MFCAGLGYWGWGVTSGVVRYGNGFQKVSSFDRKEHGGYYGKGRGAAAVVGAAQAEIGVQEVGQNTGPRVDQYGAYVGIKKQAWCAAFVCFCFGKAGYNEPRTPWSPALFPAKRSVKEPKPGTVMGLYFSSLGRVAHCGIVENARGEWLTIIEGNTNAGKPGRGMANGEREGDGVWRKMRHRRTIHCYADWL